MNEQFLKNIHTAHLIGIGGIGISAVAFILLERGAKVSGSDYKPSLLTKKLEEGGATIFIGHDASHLPKDCDLVVYSPAISKDNPELVYAFERGIQALSYPEALGMVSQGMKTIAISGTHGKTTTTAMVAEILTSANLSPTVIVGSILKKTGSNFIIGASNIFVVEACEYKRSFLNLSPDILVITNIDNDHLDYFGSLKGIQDAFTELVKKVPAYGFIVCDPSNPFVASVLTKAVARIVDYSLGGSTSKLTLAVSGDHNIKNAKVALSVARILGVDDEEAMRIVAQFQGTWRRMEYKGKAESGALVYDDYAHHPTEIKATLQGLREKYRDGYLRVIFQPHLYSRTKLLLNDFAQSFTDADEVIVAPIYAAREKEDTEINAEILAREIKKYHPYTRTFCDLPSIEKYLYDVVAQDDIVITMGAGDIYETGEALTEKKKAVIGAI